MAQGSVRRIAARPLLDARSKLISKPVASKHQGPMRGPVPPRSPPEIPLLRLVLSRLIEQGAAATLGRPFESARDEATLCQTVRAVSLESRVLRPCAPNP